MFRIPEQIGERRCRDVFGRTGRKPGRDDPEITKRDPVSKKAERDEYLTPKEFAHRMKFSENTVYCWIREGKIETLPNLGSAYRIPMSQFYKKNKIAEEVEANTKKKKNRSEQLKEEFLAILREG